jgi:2-polyprenyl-3-methyl-5-hydroxy-6-metoxy-1,4-benzoquinol methylase
VQDDQAVLKVKERWGPAGVVHWRTSRRLHWNQHPRVRERLNVLVSGHPQKDRFQYFLEKYVPQPDGRSRGLHVLTLGCGDGEFERGLAQYGLASVHEAVDLSDGAIERAIQLARTEGLSHIHYRVDDLDSLELPPNTYHVIFGISSIHHVAQLEHLFLQVALALKPGGYLFLDEFIGPSRFQWSDTQLDLINDQIAALPERFKRSLTGGGSKGPVWRHSLEEMNEVDPSEAVRSAEILPVLKRYVDILEVRGYGGSLLHLLLEDIAGNFDLDDREAMAYLDALFQLEDALIASGTLQHDFAIVIARKPTALT